MPTYGKIVQLTLFRKKLFVSLKIMLPMQTSTKNWMLMSVMALGLVASLSSCKDDKKPEPKPDPAEFAVVEDEVAVPFEGGAAQVTYTLENPVEGGGNSLPIRCCLG